MGDNIDGADGRGSGSAGDDRLGEREADSVAICRLARDREERAERLAGRFDEMASSEAVVSGPALRPAVAEVDADSEPEP